MHKPKVYIKKNVAVLVARLIEIEYQYNDFAKVLGDTYDSLIADGWFPQSCFTSKKTLTQIFIRKDKKDEIQRVSIAQQEYPFS